MESSPKLVRHIGSESTWFAEQLSLCFARTATASPYACESWCLMARLPPYHDIAAEHHTRGLLNAVLSLSSLSQACPLFSAVIESFLKNSIHIRQCGLVRPEFFLLGVETITFRDNLALVPWHVRVTSAPRTTIH